jgi:methylenetetrahydrofolate--tRNA-(uracil-5-)-methyltransferase
MKWPDQKAMLRALPGFADVRILRYGTIHRNIFLDVPRLCDPYMADRRRDGLYYAGQICGVEGYVESIMSAMVVALSIYARIRGRAMPALPRETMMGALMEHVHTPVGDFQPMNANMGILPRPEGLRRGRRGRRERNQAISSAAIAAMNAWREEHNWLFP